MTTTQLGSRNVLLHIRKSLALVSALGLILVVTQSASAATAPTVTITTPTNGQIIEGNEVTVTGTYQTEAPVRSVSAVMCSLGTVKTCQTYVQDTNGTMATPFMVMTTTLADSTQLSGTYEHKVSNLQPGRYRVRTFTTDATGASSVRVQYDFTMVGAIVPPPAGPGYITVLWGRTNWQATSGANCSVVTPLARTLEENAKDLQARGLFGVGGVVVNRTGETDRSCYAGYTTQPSWADLTNLRSAYGWHFISQGMNYSDMTAMTTDDQRYQESGATLPIFEAHGFYDAWGAFNYANNKQNLAAQTEVTKYFAFGRAYGNQLNGKAAATKFPYKMNTFSVNGGRCNNPALACSTMKVVNNRVSDSPAVIGAMLKPGADQWGVVQFYRIVDGTYGRMGDGFAWDCSSPNWQDRWTSQPEIYCRNSYLEILDMRSPTAVVADPATVAEAWGRIPASPSGQR